MTFKKGDTVSVIDEDITGEVITVNGNKITINTPFGFPETYKCDRLVITTSILTKIDSLELKEEDFKIKHQPKKNQKNNDFLEVDLHIGHLVDYTKGLSNFEMLSIQLKTARETLERVIKNKTPKRIVFLHGHGEGVLRKELFGLLDNYTLECHYYDASFQRYKQGATEVEIF